MLVNSVIINYIINESLKLKNSYSQSLLIIAINKLFEFINRLYKNTFFYSMTVKISRIIRIVFKNSQIVEFFLYRDNSNSFWKESKFYKVNDFLFNLPYRVLIYAYEKNENKLIYSVIIKYFKKTIKRTEYIIGLPLLIMLVIPHYNWYNMYGVYMVIFSMSIYLLRAVLFRHEFINIKAFDVSAIIFILMAFLHTITSIEIGLSIRFFLFHLTGFLFLVMVISGLKTRISLKNFIKILVLGLFVTAIYGVWQGVTKSIPFNASLSDVTTNQGAPGRIFSTMGNPNNYAEVLVIFSPYVFVLFLNAKELFKKVFYIITALTIALALLYTGSRSGWIGMSVVIFIILYFKNKKLIPLFLLLGVFTIPFLPEHIMNRMISIFNSSNDSSMKYRGIIFETVGPIIKDYYLTGMGLGTDLFTKLTQNYKIISIKNPLHTHILVIQILIEMGILGLMTFLALVYRVSRRSIVKIISSNDIKTKNILIAGVASLAGVLVISIVEYIWFYPRVLIFFWVNLGIIMASLNIIDRQKFGDNL